MISQKTGVFANCFDCNEKQRQRLIDKNHVECDNTNHHHTKFCIEIMIEKDFFIILQYNRYNVRKIKKTNMISLLHESIIKNYNVLIIQK